MNSTPANTLYPAPVAELAYSDGRWRRFQFCRRGFLFHYVTCRGGYDPVQPEAIRKLYCLKHLISFDRWIDGILLDAVGEVSTRFHTPNRRPQELRQTAMTRLARDCHHLRRESWRDDPAGYPQLSELHFGTMDAFALNRQAEEALQLRLEYWNAGYDEALTHHCPGGFEFAPGARSAHHQGVTVFLPRSLVWREGFRLRWVVSGIPAEPDDAWIRYYAWTQLCVNPIHVELEFADFARGEAVQIPPDEFNFSAAAERSLAQARIMRDWLVETASASPEAIPATPEHCTVCRYREYCRTLEAS